jgi:bifunctional enzyme CysN/CysC
MTKAPRSSANDALAFIEEQEKKDLLRFITCGSVDDGKSTLIGRLLYDSKLLFEDQLAALEADRKPGKSEDEPSFSSLVDGLSAEREQGITIDVAYRFFSTTKRKFIVADTPGHEQYTRNMATGASGAELAVILVDARHGVLTQTRRHSYITSLMGIRQVVLAVNKMDLMDFSEAVFSDIDAEFRAFAESIGMENVKSVPISAKKGDNVVAAGSNCAWYNGPTFLELLEAAETGESQAHLAFRFPVQWINRAHQDFRGLAGTIASGVIKLGDEVTALPSNKSSRIKNIVTADGELKSASAGQAVTLTLEDEIDISRGDLVCKTNDLAGVTDQFEAATIWMDDHELLPGRPYLIKIGHRTVPALVTRLKHKVNVNTLEKQAAKSLQLNEIGVCNFGLDQQIAFDPYGENHATGSFIIIDRMTNNTAGAGMIDFGLMRAENIPWQHLDINKAARSARKGQKPCVLWFTGLSGSGKSTIANLVEKKLHAAGYDTYALDGDNVRHGLNKDLGFTDADRVENIRRVAEVAKLFVDSGMITLVSFISPFRSERRLARSLMEEGEFVEVFVDTPLEVCEERDSKGLYKKARAGEIKNFTGIDSNYEPPERADIVLKTVDISPEKAAERLISFLKSQDHVR